jgi:hypothetical protein
MPVGRLGSAGDSRALYSLSRTLLSRSINAAESPHSISGAINPASSRLT